jgi:two-component system C4-dicarboxylate transport sensor histidine kinase DctB
MNRVTVRFAILAGVVGIALISFVAGEAARRIAVQRFEAQLSADVRLRQALLVSEVTRYRLLPRALADDRDVVAALDSPGAATASRLNSKLEQLAGEVRAPVIYVIDSNGKTVASSNWRDPDSFVGRDYRFRPYFRDALRTGEGEQFALGTVSRKPGLYIATRAAARLGVIVVKLEFDAIEAQWRQAQGITFVTDGNGVILVSSRPDWRFAATQPLSASIRRTEEETSGVSAIARQPFTREAGNRIVPDGEGKAYLLRATRLDAARWQVNLALPLGPAVDPAVRSAQFVAGLIALILVGLIAFLLERTRQRNTRTAQLEAAVAERTAELRNEMTERASAEQRAAQLREGLRQANRLATLGQVTASVAHETAQPVAAIRNYAANSAVLLDRGKEQDVRTNLAAISRLADRIGTVTAHLRGFARKGSGGIGPVALDEVVDGAMLILREHLARVTLHIAPVQQGLQVQGDPVRLEQVLVNLIQNAIEALHGVSDPRIEIAIAARPDQVVITVSDNGPGIDPQIASALFTPFATSRATGLGLGLVIAKDIVEEFGGTLTFLPGESGACFEIVLVRSK